AHPPARLVGHHPVGSANGLADGLVGRFAARSGSQDGVGAATATEPNPEKALQAARHLAMRQATLLVEFDDRGLGVRPQLGSGGAKGIGGLQGMAALDPAAALTALAAVDVELAGGGVGRGFDLDLLGGLGI